MMCEYSSAEPIGYEPVEEIDEVHEDAAHSPPEKELPPVAKNRIQNGLWMKPSTRIFSDPVKKVPKCVYHRQYATSE